MSGISKASLNISPHFCAPEAHPPSLQPLPGPPAPPNQRPGAAVLLPHPPRMSLLQAGSSLQGAVTPDAVSRRSRLLGTLSRPQHPQQPSQPFLSKEANGPAGERHQFQGRFSHCSTPLSRLTWQWVQCLSSSQSCFIPVTHKGKCPLCPIPTCSYWPAP